MATALSGGLPSPDDVVSSDELWRDEPRVGIQRDDSTGTVREQMLYTSRHVRPSHRVGIGMRVQGVPDGWRAQCAEIMPLGGEGRLAHVEDWAGDGVCQAGWEEILSNRNAMVIALTPIDPGEALYLPGDRIGEAGDVTVVSACLPRVERVGGWASDGKRSGPLPLRSLLPAGTTFFCEVGDPVALRSAYDAAGGLLRVGRWQRWGLGAVALGVWPSREESI
jgi:CRISPR-associated protein Cmr3